MGVVPAARQPRRLADRRAEPARVRAPLPRPRRSRAGRRSSARSRSPPRRRAARRRSTSSAAACAAAVHRAGAAARAAAGPARRADGRSRPAGPPELWALIDRMRSEGVSILMSTHYIEEAERLCDEVTIMSTARPSRSAPARADRRARRARGARGLRAACAAYEVEGRRGQRGWRTRAQAHRSSILHVERRPATSTASAA